jgi:glycosyltransferase involved in cell wall biosynthesis
MRVLEVTESFATGTMEVVRLVAERTAREGHEVAIAYGVRPETPVELRGRIDAEVDVVELPWAGRTLPAQLRAARALRRLCREWKPDVIHLHSSFAGVVGSLAIARMAQTVYTPHAYSFLAAGSRLRRMLYRAAERFVAHRVSLVGAVSESEARLARQIGAGAVEVVSNGIPELDQPPARPRPPEEPSMVMAMGRIVPQRRPLSTARILSSVADIATVGWIGGAGPDERLEHEVRAHGVPVTGWLDRDAAVDRLSRCTVLLNWSAWDSHPLGVLEAMASDVLVIASDIEANRDLVGPEQVCASEEQAARVLRDVLTDRNRLAELLDAQGKRGRRFGASRMGSDWLRVYERLATPRAEAAATPAKPAGAGRSTP